MMTEMISPAEATKEGRIITAVAAATGAAVTPVIGTMEEAETIIGIGKLRDYHAVKEINL